MTQHQNKYFSDKPQFEQVIYKSIVLIKTCSYSYRHFQTEKQKTCYKNNMW